MLASSIFNEHLNLSFSIPNPRSTVTLAGDKCLLKFLTFSEQVNMYILRSHFDSGYPNLQAILNLYDAILHLQTEGFSTYNDFVS